MSTAPLALALLASTPAGPQTLERLLASLAPAGARVAVVSMAKPLPDGCALARVQADRRLAASGRYQVRLSGSDAGANGCELRTWLRVKVVAAVRVAARDLKAGESLEPSSTSLEDREIVSGHEPLTDVPEGSVLARGLSAGAVVETSHLRPPGPGMGDPLTVMVQAGPVSIVQQGRAVPCVSRRVCAQLPSGKRVEGRLVDGRLLVEVP